MTAYVYWIRGQDFADMAAISADSARKVDPKAKIHVCSDDPELVRPKWADVFHQLQPGKQLMVANLDAQLTVLEYIEHGERILFLDADTIMRKPFPWTLAADLHVTYRHTIVGADCQANPATLQPYNYGVLGVNHNYATLEAFMWMRMRVLQMSSRAQLWYGNQLALADLCGGAPVEGVSDKRVPIRWTMYGSGGRQIAVRMLPCDTWNYSPSAEGEDIADKGILHFKGSARKALMQSYLESA